MLNQTKEELVKKPFKGLFEFLKEYSIIGMAIGVVFGQVSKDLVDALVRGIFMPCINLIIPGESLEKMVMVVNGTRFDFGLVLNTLLTFLIVMTFLYVLVKKILKREDLLQNR